MARPDIAAGPRDFDAIRIGRIPPQILIEGDSIPAAAFGTNSQSILFWMGFNPRSFVYNPATDNLAVPGSNSDTTGATSGLLSSSRLSTMTTRIAAVKDAGRPVVVILNIGMNGTASTLIADVRKAWNTYRAAGADQLIIMSVDPSSGAYKMTPALAAVKIGNNAALAEFARQNAHEVQYSDASPYLLKNDPNAADDVYPPQGDATNTVGSMTYDGIHGNGNSGFHKARPLVECVARVTPSAPPSRIISPYATGARGNLMGSAGRMSQGGGQASQNTIGSGLTGIENFPADGGGIAGTLAGMTCAITRVPYTPIPTLMATRFTFSGTTTGDSNLIFGRDIGYTSGAWDASTPIELEADMYLDALRNFRHLRISGSVAGVGSALGNAAGNSNASDTITAPVTGRFRPRAPVGFTASPGTFSGQFGISFPAGVTVSGSIELLGYGAFLNPALPAATA
jgi:lysophospholipase L1-like esterase